MNEEVKKPPERTAEVIPFPRNRIKRIIVQGKQRTVIQDKSDEAPRNAS
jgi:hypothetical protein